MSWNNGILNIWLIDDSIPIVFLGEDGLHISDNALPIRSDFLRMLVNGSDENWSEPNVKELVEEILRDEEIIPTGFLHPTACLKYLKLGGVPPDLVIFDWEYTSGADQEHEVWLREILESGFTFIQIYTHKSPDEIEEQIKSIQEEFTPQLLGVSSKTIQPNDLITTIKGTIDGTLAGEIISQIKKVTSEAIGRALREFAQIDKQILTNSENDVGKSQELLAHLLEREIGVSGEDTDDSILGAVALSGACVLGETIRDSQGIRNCITAIIEAAPSVQSTDNQNFYRQFQSYQIYTKHKTDRVIRGDIVQFDDETVGLIITPPCNLARFAKKTRNTLTYIPMYECNSEGWAELANGHTTPAGNEYRWNGNDKMKNSMCDPWRIGSEGIFVLSSVPFGKNNIPFKDYFILSSRIEYKKIGISVSESLLYSQLKTQFGIDRLGTLSDSYLNSLLWAVGQALFSPGTKDYMTAEQNRLQAIARTSFGSVVI